MGKRVGKVATVKDAGTTSAPISMAGEPSEGKRGKPRQTCLHSQLRKTKFCFYQRKGGCQMGENCPFAHSRAELKETPDLRKTRLCVDFFEGPGCSDPDCFFAHSEDDLRCTENFYKKALCIWNERGKCWKGEQCRFAHGLSELHAHNGVAPALKRAKEPGVRQLLTAGGAMGRQVNEKTTSTGCCNLDNLRPSDASTLSSSCGNLSTLSSSDASGSIAATKSRPGRRGRRGQQGPGQVAGNQPLQARRGNETRTGEGAMPMKVLPNPYVMAEPPQLDYTRPAQAVPLAHTETHYDPALQAELMRLRYSVSALAAKCSQLNEQMFSETLKAEANERVFAQAIMTQRLIEQAQQHQQQRQQYAGPAASLAPLGKW